MTYESTDPEILELEARYWAVLGATLEYVFDTEAGIANSYRREIAEAAPFQRALALHDDPLDLASVLTGQPISPLQMERYASLIQSLDRKPIAYKPTRKAGEREVYSSMRRYEDAPMVTVKTLNKYMRDIGYGRLQISGGIAYFVLDKRKRPLPPSHKMETMPGVNADREEVYGLDRVLNLLNGLQEYARRARPNSSILDKIEKMKSRLLQTHLPIRF